MPRYNTIRLAVNGRPGVLVEYVCSTENIIPGMQLEILADGTVRPSTSDDPETDTLNQTLIAIENIPLGGGVVDDISDLTGSYQAGDIVQCQYFGRGDKAWCWLAPNQTTVIGSPVTPTGAAQGVQYSGTLEAVAGTPVSLLSVVGYALEAATTGPGEVKRVAITIK